MKSTRLLILISFTIFCFGNLFAQTKNYDTQWKKINELIQKKNLPKSALEEVKKIYGLAKKEKQDAQVVKSLVYISVLQQENRENNQLQSIKEIEKEIRSNNEPAVSILNGLLADLYWQYLQNNRWRFYERTNTINFNKDDPSTWTIEDLHQKISELYLQSIKNEQLLKQTTLEPYNAIIIKGNVRHLRPTLFDLLAHHALEYFKIDELNIKKPAYAFEINQPAAFATAPVFVPQKFTTKDSLSLQHKALLIYQGLISFHLKDRKPDALIDVDIDRIQFVFQNSVSENKDSLYLKALEYIIEKFRGNPLVHQAQFLLASWHEEKARQYQPLKDTTYRYFRLRSRTLLTEVVKDSNIKTEGWVNSYNLLKEIDKKSFSFKLEKVNVPGQPFRTLINFTNIDRIFFRLVKAEDVNNIELNDVPAWIMGFAEKPLKTWEQALPKTNDLQRHAVEIKIDALPVGKYLLLAVTDKVYDPKKSVAAAQYFFVSNISYTNQQDKFFVLHRETGQPLVNTAVEVYKREYNYKTYKYSKTKLGSYKSDGNGFFSITPAKNERNNEFYLDINYKDDRLNLDESVYSYYNYDIDARNLEDTVKKIFFFTDRSIYRPGQTVYFKGIALTQRKNQNNIATNYKTTIYLRNANYQLSDSILVTTNEFGSFNGKFQLPMNLLNGNFYIIDKEQRNNTSFSVEEYKRPKFYVDFEKIKKSYKVNEMVTITGNAKAYAGNNIEGAKVSYRVVRRPRFIYTWFMTKWWQPPSEEMEIAHGEITTDKNGKFNIEFTAIPDKKIDIKFDPVFDYAISADVTDINGETRSAKKIVTAGYKSLLLQVTLAGKMPVDSLKNIFIRTENMNGEYQSSTISVSISNLIPEQRLVRNRYWEQPDQFIMNKEEYIRYFPHDEYKNESDFHTWPKGEIVFTKNDSTRMNGQWTINNSSFLPGYYLVEVSTKDKDGKEIKDARYVELFDPKSNRFNKPEYLWAKGTERPIEPGESTSVQIGSSANNVFVINQVDKPSTGISIRPIRQPSPRPEEPGAFQFIHLNNEKKTFNYIATEADRGGYGVNFFFVKDNRFYQFGDVISVPWTNKELKIEYTSFRDKTLPGSEEKWKVKITGYKNEKLAVEMLASMYDASLDQFREHNWNEPGVWPNYYQKIGWNSNVNFRDIESAFKEIDVDRKNFKKQYDWFFFDVNRSGSEGLASGAYRLMRRTNEGNIMYETVSLQKDMKTSSMTNPPAMDGSNGNRKDTMAKGDRDVSQDKINNKPQDNVQSRKNFNETAFFLPELRTDENGNIEFSFTTPEALTKWKLQTIAHTKDLAFGISEKEMVTQKQLMVQPNMPRFLRQGDHMEMVAKIVNMSDSELTGQAQLELFDAATNQTIDGWFINNFPNQFFTLAAGQSQVVKFPIQVPFQFNSALKWRLTARTKPLSSGGSVWSDGEEDVFPVLTNKLLVTETLPLPMRGPGTKNFTFEKLLKSGKSETLQNQSLTVEYTSNPAWYAVQALPYLMDYPYECAEQNWNRYYANALATKIANSSPRIKQIFEKWSSTSLSTSRGPGGEADTSALLSNLLKNQELKSALLEETPWVLEAKSETEQKKNIALLFDMVRMSRELQTNLEKLKQMQTENGGFVWFKGGPDDRYITQYIVTGLGHLKKLKALSLANEKDLNFIEVNSLRYLDLKLSKDYSDLLKTKAKLSENNISFIQIQYLYARSFFDVKSNNEIKAALNYYTSQAKKFWMKQNKFMQGMIALALHRTGDKLTPLAILKSLKETSISNEEMGMYWKDNSFGYSWFWWHAPIETQALMIEAFSEIGHDVKTVDDLRTWLIKNKQTNNWRTTKATADACYAMLLQGTDWLSNESSVQIILGNTTISNDQKTELGTGYFKQAIEGKIVKPEMGNISVTIGQQANLTTSQPVNSPSWGSVYWQYFEDMDKITTASTPLQLNKKLFIEKNTDRGPVLTPVSEGTELQVGDKIKVRIELRVDRDMDYIHMKDMRASAMEPVNVLSGYKWQGGLGYYESTKDASTNFFFNYLQKGTYVFEYSLFVTHAGNFSNGITTIQCMYAPEFSAHSEGGRISVD